MPLTIAHPAAVLPFRQGRFPMSALVIGSIAPDFEYVLHLSPRSDFSHTALGLFAFCLPAGLIALWIFHRIWVPPIVAMLGREHSHRARPFPFWPIGRLAILCGEILIGALTHLIWDSFTQDYGWLVQRMDGLSRTVMLVGSVEVPLYLVLQHASSLLGIAVLLFAVFYHHKWTWPAFSGHWPLLAVIGWLTIAGGVALGMLAAGDVSTTQGLMRWPGCGLVIAATVFFLVTTFLCVMWHIRRFLAHLAL